MDTDIKIGVVGRSGSGKSTFIKRLSTGQFRREYQPTYGLEETRITYNFILNGISIQLNIKLIEDKKIVQKYNAIIVFMDEDESLIDNFKYFNSLPQLDVPIVICSTKGDEKSRAWYRGNKRKGAVATLCHKRNYHVYQISSLNNYNIEKPILYLIRKILDNDSITYS